MGGISVVPLKIYGIHFLLYVLLLFGFVNVVSITGLFLPNSDPNRFLFSHPVIKKQLKKFNNFFIASKQTKKSIKHWSFVCSFFQKGAFFQMSPLRVSESGNLKCFKGEIATW